MNGTLAAPPGGEPHRVRDPTGCGTPPGTGAGTALGPPGTAPGTGGVTAWLTSLTRPPRAAPPPQHPTRASPRRAAAAARSPSPASEPVASPPGYWPRGSPDRTGSTGRRRACTGPMAMSCPPYSTWQPTEGRITPMASADHCATRRLVDPRGDLLRGNPIVSTLLGVFGGPLGTVPSREVIYRRRGVHSWSRPPEPARPGAVPTRSARASHCEPTPAQHDRPCDAVVGFITWLTNRPNSLLRTNDSAHFEENSIAYSAECSRQPGPPVWSSLSAGITSRGQREIGNRGTYRAPELRRRRDCDTHGRYDRVAG